MTTETPALDNVHRTIGAYHPPSKRQWILWISGLVIGISLLIGMVISIFLVVQVNNRTAQSPAQYQQLHRDLLKLQGLAKQELATNPSAQTTYAQIEAQIKDLCGTVPGCVWSKL